MSLYPKVIVGKILVQKVLGSNQKNRRLYLCNDLESIRQAVNDLFFLTNYPDEVLIYLRYPTHRQYECLLKFLEESQLKIVLLVPFDSISETIISRISVFHKEDEVVFKDFLDDLKGSVNMKQKIFELFGRSYSTKEEEQTFE